MSNISTYLNRILSSRYGKDVRQSIHDAIEELNAVAVTAQGSASISAQTASTKASEANTSKEAAAKSATTAEEAAARAVAVSGVGVASETVAGLMAGGDNTVDDSGTLVLTRKTTDRTLAGSKAGGVKINEVQGASQQASEPTIDVKQDIKSSIVRMIKAVNKNLWSHGDVSGTISVAKGFKLEAGTYMISALVTSSDTDATQSLMQITREDGVKNTLYFNRGYRDSRVITLPCKAVTFNLYASNGYSSSEGDTFTWSDIQIEKGSTMTEFEPHREFTIQLSNPITLRSWYSIAKDIIGKQDGVWCVLRDIAQKTVSTVNGVTDINTNTVRCYSQVFTDRKAGSYTNGLCDSFIISASANKEVEHAIFNKEEEYKQFMYFFINKSRVSVSEETTAAYYAAINNLLKENPVLVQYVLATPVFEPLPIADQIALHQLESFDTITHLFTDSEIEPTIECEYGTSVVGGYALKALNTAEVNALKTAQLEAAVLSLGGNV